MKSITTFILVLMLVACGTTDVNESTKGNTEQSKAVVWSADTDMEIFWAAYTESTGGLTWPASSEYPEYNKVREGDTFMVLLPQGKCLMEFFHSRWRRANDVRRWDESVNEYGGCPYVFD